MANVEASDVICACFNLTLEELRRRQKVNPGLPFEDLMRDTGAGTKCTACLLDLEYYFVGGAGAQTPAQARRRAIAPRKGLKRRLYDFVDAFAPQRAYVSRTVAPVIAGDGFEEFLWIANHPLLYAKDGVCAPAHIFNVQVTGGRGNIVLSAQHTLQPDASLRIDIATALREPDGLAQPFAVGMLMVETFSIQPGMRGTTRPQIEILTPRSACAVHTQAASPQAGAGALWVPCRLGEDRIFMIFMNPSPRVCGIDIRYPHNSGRPAVEGRLCVDPRGAGLYELKLDRASTLLERNQIMHLSWHADGPHKAYLLCATPDLDRFSVDHI